MRNWHNLCKNEPKMWFLAILSSLVGLIGLIMHVMIVQIVSEHLAVVKSHALLISHA